MNILTFTRFSAIAARRAAEPNFDKWLPDASARPSLGRASPHHATAQVMTAFVVKTAGDDPAIPVVLLKAQHAQIWIDLAAAHIISDHRLQRVLHNLASGVRISDPSMEKWHHPLERALQTDQRRAHMAGLD